ncbi:hypothetical protein ACFFX1_21915 [Dactylosporangium sucinum]|uniref:Uncharacterized protein n=1 Tax=Dactylosporangium sucinum TaxID=1424081 RepID=A0A917TZ22_9ACTN|nr:hypothetical protein [Dactylosporangium sucinum]GGM46197.1 hypothetical protein GCM10007977_054940 [Dactylosporangium sucinum]
MQRSISLTVGLVLSGLLGLVDVVSLPLGADGPPMAVLVIGAALGIGTVAGVVLAWPNRSRAGAVTVIVTRLLSALTAVPAFFVATTPGAARVAAAAGIVVTLLCVALVAPALRARPA